MTVLHDQRYTNACARNVPSRLGHKPTADYKIAYFAGMELEDLKHNVGVRKNDTKFDLDLGAWLGQVKAHAEKVGVKAKAKKAALTKEEAVALNDNGEPLISKEFVASVEKVVYSADSPTFDAKPEKKVNPKKAARQAALEASGTAPKKKVNADEARAAFSATQAKRTPRIQTKH